MRENNQGFTLVELLIVIAVIAILAAVAFVAIDPATRFAEARNSQRWSDVASILEATQQYIVDNTGTLPTGLTKPGSGSTSYVIGTGSGTASCSENAAATSFLNLSSSLVTRYFASMPMDPSNGAAADTQYYLTIDSDGHITIGACAPEEVRGATPDILVTR